MGAFLLLGSNQGDRLEILQQAGRLINEQIGRMVLRSSVYVTKAWGQTNQPDFLNQVLQIETTLSAFVILNEIQTIEKQLGRKRMEKWGPRLIDIDLLYYDDLVIESDDLIVPHPQIPFRRFTLEPLVEIAPNFIHPISLKTQIQLLDECPDLLNVDKLSGVGFPG